MKQISPKQITANPIHLIASHWMLVTAGNMSDFNTMTASWGMVGEMWGMDVAETVVRPQRYTHEYIERTGKFTLSFFPENMRKILTVMGTHSGREMDKMHYPGLTAVELPSGEVTFKEASLVIECEVVYKDCFKAEAFVDKQLIGRWYPESDFHTRYIGRITNVWTADDDVQQ